MAYEHGFNYELPPQQYGGPPRSYTTSQLDDENQRGYRERPLNGQGQNGYGPSGMHQPYGNGYAQDDNGANGAARFQAGGAAYNGNRVHRSPPAQYPAGNYARPMNRSQMQPPLPKQIDTRRGGYHAPAPHSGGPYQESNNYYMHDQPHAPRHLQGGRGLYNGGGRANHNGYVGGNDYGYNRSETHYDPSYDGQNEIASRPQNGHQNQSHRRGHSDGYGQGSQPVPQNADRNVVQKRPNNGHSKYPNNGGHDMQRRRMFNTQISPETVSWDNPFPTFPGAKKKGVQHEKSLDGSMADMSLRGGMAKSGDVRPQTANSRDKSMAPNARYPQNAEFIDQRGENYQYDQPAYNSQMAQQQDIADESKGSPIGTREDKGFVQGHSVSDYGHGRRLAEPLRGPPLRHQGAVQLESGRSKTMPSAVSNAVMARDQEGYTQASTRQNSDRNMNDSTFDTRGHQPVRPSTASGVRPAGPGETRSGEIARIRADQTRSPMGNVRPHAQQKAIRPPVVHQDSIADLYDSYYEPSAPTQPHDATQNWNHNHRVPVEEDLPDFDALNLASPGHQRITTIEDHINPPIQQPKMPPMPAQYRHQSPSNLSPGTRSRQIMQSKSQPDLKHRSPPRTYQDSGFDFGIPQHTAVVLDAEYRTNVGAIQKPSERHEYDLRQDPYCVPQQRPPGPHRSNGGYQPADTHIPPNGGTNAYNNTSRPYTGQEPSQPYRTGSRTEPSELYGSGVQEHAHNERYRSTPSQEKASINRPSPAAPGPASPPQAAITRPDALPAHPAPVRPGLMQSPSPSRPPKPAPVRNYNNNASPLQAPNTTQPPGSTPEPADQTNGPTRITSNELNNSRLAAKANPADKKAQMTLAKNLVLAATALEAYVPQTDQKARNKTREKYVSEAHKTIKRLVSSGYPDAMFFLGDCYSQGRLGLDKDSKEAFTLYQGAAKAGHAQAAFRVAVCCELGLEEDGGTKRDLGKAVQWYKRAATLGDTPAMYKTGVIQLKGLLGQPKDSAEALVWLRKAAEKADKDNPHALHELALWHEAAVGSGKAVGDEAYAKQLFVQAAELGYKYSQYRLGRAWEYGMMGCPIDPRLSISWYSKAAIQEEHQSELALSGWYLTGSEGVLQQSDTEAYLWARKAATAGLAKAEFAMGYFTEVGIGCPPSAEEAKRWYWRAACKSCEVCSGYSADRHSAKLPQSSRAA